MSNSMISKHSKSAFDESESIRILEELLESTREIKTFFSENDRTPNYDGTFELVNNECEPVKQFIVQIKKVDKLIQNTKGKNIGKYDYSLKTNFLQYVKDRVTECPAIYFVVDLSTKKVFWIYLSDETLMRLNFEGKKTVTYHFQETEFISDINSFILEMRHIAQERNRLFVYKTSQQISELQDAVDYLNQHLNGDLKKIKERVLPNLWRIGIKYSSNHDIQFNKTAFPINGCVALYPQMRGILDTGVRENDLIRRTNEILARRGENFYSIFECAESCVEDFKNYCLSGRDNKNLFRGNMLNFLTVESIRWMMAIFELQRRNVKKIKLIWNYHWYNWIDLDETDYLFQCENICKQLFSNLPELYEETYYNIFDTSKYLIRNKYDYKLICNNIGDMKFLCIDSQCYSSKKLGIQMNPFCTSDFPDGNVPEGLISTTGSATIQRFIQQKNLYYDSICCLLYRGVCKGLEFEEKDLPLYEHENIKFYL